MLVFLTLLLVVPHYIFSVDLHLSFNLDTSNNMRSAGVERVVIMQQQIVPVERSDENARQGAVSDNAGVEQSSNGGVEQSSNGGVQESSNGGG